MQSLPAVTLGSVIISQRDPAVVMRPSLWGNNDEGESDKVGH